MHINYKINTHYISLNFYGDVCYDLREKEIFHKIILILFLFFLTLDTHVSNYFLMNFLP